MLVAVVAVGMCVGIGSGGLQAAGVALVGLQSLAAGVLVGLLLIGGAAAGGFVKPRWPAAVIAALAAVMTQHVWLYRVAMEARREAAADQPAVELFRPGWTEQSFVEFMQSEATTQTLVLWSVDACLLVLAAVVMVELSGKWQVASGE